MENKLNKDSLYFQEHHHLCSSLIKRLSFIKSLKPGLITYNHYLNHKICFLLYCVNEALQHLMRIIFSFPSFITVFKAIMIRCFSQPSLKTHSSVSMTQSDAVPGI